MITQGSDPHHDGGMHIPLGKIGSSERKSPRPIRIHKKKRDSDKSTDKNKHRKHKRTHHSESNHHRDEPYKLKR